MFVLKFKEYQLLILLVYSIAIHVETNKVKNANTVPNYLLLSDFGLMREFKHKFYAKPNISVCRHVCRLCVVSVWWPSPRPESKMIGY